MPQPLSNPLSSHLFGSGQLSDMRGQMIFEANSYRDVGAFQLYGNAQDEVTTPPLPCGSTALRG